jgi:hypothetical protein
MSSTDRQNRLLQTEDWKRVYQSFRNADFQSYDFDNLRRTMIQYLRENYPEDFNDYVESSEYLALIDLIAFLGQNISFRIDLNARENYLELAERRESVLRLARLLSYNPKRNQVANGLLKIDSVRTSEEIIDSNGTNLQNQTIVWNDPANVNWYEQFIKVLNTALPVNGTFGRPNKKEMIAGISTEQYRFNSINSDIPTYGFNKTIDGRATRFEVVSTDIADTILEEAPFPGNNFAFIYRDDGKGPSSNNTGFFSHFRQGVLDQGTFTVSNPSSNQTVAIETPNINNTDVWLYDLDSVGNEKKLWTKVDSLEGNNIIYNSVQKNVRDIYSVLTRVDDRISLIFSDGVFGNLPKGNFKVYFRTGLNQRVTVRPKDFRNITVNIPYLSKKGREEKVTIVYSLKYTVDNSAISETTASIKSKAPSTFYTQNRMITGEDYQVAPLGINQQIIKTKSVNRTSSGISRYFDLIDATGKYSQTTLYGNDGVVYKEYQDKVKSFTFTTRTDVEGAVENTIIPILQDVKVRNYYFDKFPRILTRDLNIKWQQTTKDTEFTSGYFSNVDGIPSTLGSFTSSILRLVKEGTLIKFVAPGYVEKENPLDPDTSTNHFDKNGNLVNGPASVVGDTYYKWVKIISINGTGFEEREDGLGAVLVNEVIPTDAILAEIKPPLANDLGAGVKQQLYDQIFAYKVFGLRFDQVEAQWKLVTENNLAIGEVFSTGKTGDTTNQQLDASWLLLFENNGESYSVTYRSMRYVFESDNEIRFYYDSNDKIYDNKTGKVVKDTITVLNINPKDPTADPNPFTQDFKWEIVDAYRDAEGYVDSKKLEVSYYDDDEDGIVDDADLFEEIVSPTVNSTSKYIIFKKYVTEDGVEDFNYYNNENQDIIVLNSKTNIRPFSEYEKDGQVFYYIDEDIFEVLDLTTLKLNLTTDYKARLGRDGIKFRYIHAAGAESRIDPSASNIIDMYLLTKNYDNEFRLWLTQKAGTKPLPPSSDQLYIDYGNDLNKIKSLTDEIIYHPVKYKILFGSEANDDLQARFKIVKNTGKVINDNDVKARVITAITEFFALENWDFGETFYFSELANYVMTQLSPDISAFVIVPVQESQAFGSLYEIKAEADEIFISGATVDSIDIIDALTASKLKAQGEVVLKSTTANVGVQSTTVSSDAQDITNGISGNSSSSNGGYSY